MAIITPGYTAGFIDEYSKGTHNLDADIFKLALYNDSVTLGLATTAYSATNEASGTGYSAGGVAMTLASGYPSQDAATGIKSYRFNTVTWPGATFGARAGLMYNSSKSNKSVMVLDFGALRSVTASTFSVAFPTTLPPIITIRG